MLVMLLIRGVRTVALFVQGRDNCVLHMPIKSPFADRLDMLFQAGALGEHKDIADCLLFGASIPLCNRFVEETAAFFGDCGFSFASRSRFRQKRRIGIVISIGSCCASKVGHPMANGTRGW